MKCSKCRNTPLSVRDARRERRQTDNQILDWMVVRNRMSNITSRNEQKVASCLRNLSMQLGFRMADGISERVIFREFFPIGLTALDDFEEHVLGTAADAVASGGASGDQAIARGAAPAHRRSRPQARRGAAALRPID
jgi:hypothetical protein